MIYSDGLVVLPPSLFFLFLLISTCVAQPPKFWYTSMSLARYVFPRETTYEAIRGLYKVCSIYDLYGANNLDETILTTAKVPPQHHPPNPLHMCLW